VRVTGTELDRDQIRKLIEEFFSDPIVEQGTREMAEAHRVSHLAQGDAYFREGKPREAIEQYRKDTELEITTYALAATVEQAYCHMGDVFLCLGECANAVTAYTQALKAWRQYGCGEMPLASLAVAYLKQGQVDDVLRVCDQNPEEAADPCMRPVLAEARRLQAGGQPSSGSVRG
jgi:tetratricopeptide (TPR) repeat protein